MKKLLLPSLLVFVLAACESDPVTDTAAVQDDNAQSSVRTVDVGNKQNTGVLPPWATDPLKNSVYFDYDSYTIRSDARPLIASHAKLLADRPATKVTIQGSADERGSREYNLALGQKRAEAVRQALRLQGAKDVQIEAVSLGEESPRCTASAESCYAQNRRGDFVYLGRQ